MNAELKGTSPKAYSTMSLSMRPRRKVNSVISRSQSFAGVNSNYDRARHLTTFYTPTVSRKSGSKVRRMFSMSHKSPPPKVPQPDRVDEVYNSLKKGLGAYLQVHQMDMDKLTVQIKESKRNSRLQVKSIERFIRRLEFHTSKIDELYESYCVQHRLRDGAHNMVKAYAASPVSKEARESLAEAGKGFKEYTENMCVLENDLESQLGEFHVKMKGLAGFARLCVGDQYEIFMKYGRQRWKLKGRMEVNGKQVWDSEEIIFLPLITEFLSIKVTELKNLANHVVVGSVSCETKDLFAALPQVVAVDINDLGTIKLNLEVNWRPFDKDDQPSSSSVNKSSTVNKRFSMYNPSPPDTPSLREQAFYNMLRRQDDQENGAAWSISSESSDDSSSPQLSGCARHAPNTVVQPEVQMLPPDLEIAFSQGAELPTTSTDIANQEEETDQGVSINSIMSGKPETIANGIVQYSRTLSHISEVSFEAGDSQTLDSPEIQLLLNTDLIPKVVADAPSICAITAVLPSIVKSHFTQEMDLNTTNCQGEAKLFNEGVQSKQPGLSGSLELKLTSNTETFSSEEQLGEILKQEQQINVTDFPIPSPCVTTILEEHCNHKWNAETVKSKIVNTGLDEAINSLTSSLGDYRGQFPELQTLERIAKHLEELLMKRQGRFRSRTSSISLTVENALESFDFLNTASDLENSECSEDEGGENERNSSDGIHSAQCEVMHEDTVMCSGPEGNLELISTGSEHFDKAIIMHMNNCSKLLRQLGKFGPLRCQEMYALDKLMRETQILEIVCRIIKEKTGTAIAAQDVLQFSLSNEGVLPIWNECVQFANVYMCPVDTFLQVMNTRYAEQINALQQGLADSVFFQLAEEILDQKLVKRSKVHIEQVTIFQYWSHFESLSIVSMDSYIQELANEVLFLQNLNSDDQNVVLKALKRVHEHGVQKEGFKTLSLLLTNGNSRVITAVTALLRNLSENQKFREQALVCFLEQLEYEDIQTRIAGCAALGCIKAKESIDQLVYLCQTDKDEVREAAKHSLILFGEDGKIACRHLNETLSSLPRIFAPGAMASTAF
uniref:FAM65 N-terminal domain-containing protein n=1 Tax=Leptobrachium leishanense TaxID=445787 RepID=A0A8C5PVH5_9ANUR